MHASLYQPLFLGITASICFLLVFRYISSPDYRFQTQRSGFALPLLISLIFVFWLGGRPASGLYFGDSANYALGYSAATATGTVHVDLHGEWVWALITLLCKKFGLDIQGFFTVIEAGYILSVLWAVKRFMPTNPMLGMMFVFTSLMFFHSERTVCATAWPVISFCWPRVSFSMTSILSEDYCVLRHSEYTEV